MKTNVRIVKSLSTIPLLMIGVACSEREESLASKDDSKLVNETLRTHSLRSVNIQKKYELKRFSNQKYLYFTTVPADNSFSVYITNTGSESATFSVQSSAGDYFGEFTVSSNNTVTSPTYSDSNANGYVTIHALKPSTTGNSKGIVRVTSN